MTGIVQTLITIALFILILGGLVLVHEIGHFVTARLARVRVLEFGIGFPPRARVIGRGKPPKYDADLPPAPPPALPPGIEPGSDEAAAWVREAEEIERRGRGTLYTLNWLPIGGFVKLEGEDGNDAQDPHSFSSQRLPTKLVILVAGVLMNLLVSLVIFTGIALHGEPAIGVTFQEVVPGSPAAGAGLEPGDTLVTVNGEQYSAFDLGSRSALVALRENAGEAVTLGIVRADGTYEEVTVTLRVPTEENPGALGISGLAGTQVGTITYELGPALAHGAQRTVDAFGMILKGLADLGRSIVTNPTTPPEGAAGPVGIAAQIGDILWNLGPLYVLFMVGLLSANLALVNALPFPPLDGGRMLMLVLKALPYGNRISVRAEQLTYFVGFVALFTFLIWITVFDVGRLLGGGTP